MGDFVVTCQLVPSMPHLVSGSCSSPRAFGLGFLQTQPRGYALALLLAFGFAYTWPGDLHPGSSVPYPAHTRNSHAVKRSAWNDRLDALCVIWLFRKLSTVPYGHGPDNIPFFAAEKPIKRDEHFTKGKVGKFWQYSSRSRKFQKP